MRILVVEDELKMARAVRRGLEEEGYAVDAASDGEDALHRALFEDYDAIVLDVMLPGRDGFAVCRELRTKGRWAPVLMLTARDGVEDRIRGLDAGADDYLVKPFSFGELLARLRALVRRGATERPTRMTTDDVVLDPATHTVTRDEEPIDLTAREFALLEFLMRRSGEVVSRSPDPGARVGRELRRLLERRRRLRRLPSQEARGSLRSLVHPHRTRRGVRGWPSVSMPIRARLTMWYVGLLAVVLLVLGGFLTLRSHAASW